MTNKYILTLSCPDTLGIVAKVTSLLAQTEGFIIELAQYGDETTNIFFMRCVFTFRNSIDGIDVFKNKFVHVAQAFSMDWDVIEASYKPRVMILVSKTGHCLNALLNKKATGALPIEVAGVISNHRTQEEICGWYKTPFHYLPVTPDNKPEQEQQILALIHQERVDLILLARYMQILSPIMTQELKGRAINIHHSFLPSFKGAKPYHQAHERGVKLIGATAHYVSDDLDEGPIIEQEVARVNHNHTPEDLVTIGGDIESKVLVTACKLHIERRVFLNGNRTVVFD